MPVGVVAEAAPAASSSGVGLEAIASSNMAPFLTKLFDIVSATTTDRCIAWTSRGDSFVISDPDGFARDILPTYFKHNNIRSFVRQLNTYGFRKRTNISSTDEHLEFFHEKFRRDQPALLMQIKRCHQPKPHARGAAAQAETSGFKPGNPPVDTDSIKTRVSELKSRLGSLQSEIREYNTQMEHKVNLLMHILQSPATAPSTALQLQQAMLAPPRKAGAPSPPLPGGGTLTATAAPSALTASLPPGGLTGGLLGARDDLFHQLGGQVGLGLGSLGGGLGLGTLGSSLGLAGGLGGVNAASLMGSLGSLPPGSLGKSGDAQAGLAHLLEAAQRTQTEDTSRPGAALQPRGT